MLQVLTASPVGQALHASAYHKQRVDAVREACSSIQTDLDALKADLEEQKTDLDAQKADLDAHQGVLDAQKTDLDAQQITISAQGLKIKGLQRTVAHLMHMAKIGQMLRVRSLLDSARQQLFKSLTGAQMSQDDKPSWNDLLDEELRKPNCGKLALLNMSKAAILLKYRSTSIQQSGIDLAHEFSMEQHAEGVEGWAFFDGPTADALREIFLWLYGCTTEDIFGADAF